MAKISLSLAELYERAYGVPTDAFDFEEVTGNSITDFNRKEFGDYGSEYYKTDQLGREYFLPVTISYPDISKVISGLVTGDVNLKAGWDMPYPVISISGSKTIVETPMTERAGSVNELINIKSYEITVRGFLINKNNEYPEDLMKQLRGVFVVGLPVEIRSVPTDIWLCDNGYTVILQSFNTPEVRGVKNVFSYEFRFVSDMIFDLEEI